MTSSDLAKSVAEAENMCELHKERKVSSRGKFVRQTEYLFDLHETGKVSNSKKSVKNAFAINKNKIRGQ